MKYEKYHRNKETFMSSDIMLPRISNPDKVLGVSEPTNRGRSSTEYTVTTRYRNLLGYPVCIVDRNNIVATIPSSSFSKGSSELIIEYRLNFSDNVNLNWDTILNEQSSVPAIEAIKAVAKSTDVKVTAIGHEIMIEYVVSHANLSSNAFVVYLDQLDIVVAKSDRAHNTVHPYSAVGQNLLAAKAINLEGFYYQVIINDPYNEFGERYINVNGSVFKVRRTVDNGNKPGVYVHTKDQCKNSDGYDAEFGTMYYSFTEADDKVHLYSTSHMAASLGDAFYVQEQAVKTMESTAKKNLAELSIKKIELESRLKEMEFKHKQELMTLEGENTRLKDELDREKNLREQATARDKYAYERRSREDKDLYEQRSLVRKDVNEFVKWLPGILGGIIAAANIIIALQKAKT